GLLHWAHFLPTRCILLPLKWCKFANDVNSDFLKDLMRYTVPPINGKDVMYSANTKAARDVRTIMYKHSVPVVIHNFAPKQQREQLGLGTAIGTQTIKGFIRHRKQLGHHAPSCQIDNEDHHRDIEYLELESHFNEDA